MDTFEIYRALCNVPTFAGVFPSDLLPSHPLPGLAKYTLIIITDIHTETGSHWVAVHLDTRSPTGYYFDSYGLFPLIPAIRHFLRRACILWSYNARTLQGFTTDVCGQYACLFALYMDRGLSPRQFLELFGMTEPDQLVEAAFVREFGRRNTRASGGIRGGQCCACRRGE
jgi:hypothetical protein